MIKKFHLALVTIMTLLLSNNLFAVFRFEMDNQSKSTIIIHLDHHRHLTLLEHDHIILLTDTPFSSYGFYYLNSKQHTVKFIEQSLKLPFNEFLFVKCTQHPSGMRPVCTFQGL